MALNATKLQFCWPSFIAKMPLHFLEKEFSKIFIIMVNKLNISNLSIHEQRTIRFLHKIIETLLCSLLLSRENGCSIGQDVFIRIERNELNKMSNRLDIHYLNQ